MSLIVPSLVGLSAGGVGGPSAKVPTSWRDVISANNGSSYPSWAEREWHLTVGGPQMANAGNCTVSATSTAVPDTGAQNLVDGVLTPESGHAWAGHAEDLPITIQYDFDDDYPWVECAGISQPGLNGSSYGTGSERAPSAWVTQKLVGGTWVTKYSVTGQTWLPDDGTAITHIYSVA